jgi:hypothetical protein
VLRAPLDLEQLQASVGAANVSGQEVHLLRHLLLIVVFVVALVRSLRLNAKIPPTSSILQAAFRVSLLIFRFFTGDQPISGYPRLV